MIVTPEQMQALDLRTIERYKIPALLLMENAGREVAEAVLRIFPGEAKKGALILVGPGQNGGDGLVAARHLFQKGVFCRIICLIEEADFRKEAATNLKIVQGLGIDLIYPSHHQLSTFDTRFNDAGVIVDAIFGIGLSRPVEGIFKQAIEFINASSAKVISIDVASGLSAKDGSILGCAVKADMTVTMAFEKTGHFLQHAPEYTGKLTIADIGIPRTAIGGDFTASKLRLDMLKKLLKQRPITGHKGTFGHLLIVAGSKGKSGAAELCAQGALRSGAGLITVATPASTRTILATKLTEAMTEGLPETQDGTLSLAAINKINSLSAGKKAIVLGPGIGLSDEAQEAARTLVKKIALPMILDADALTAIGTEHELVKKASAPRVLTPHPGEMARLLGCETSWVQRNRFDAAKKLANDTGAVVVLKGAFSLICSPEGEMALNPTGNSAMGAGGMGDVLAGMIGAFLAQGYNAFDATRIAVFCHGLCGDMLTKIYGPFGIRAMEVADNLPKIWQNFS